MCFWALAGGEFNLQAMPAEASSPNVRNVVQLVVVCGEELWRLSHERSIGCLSAATDANEEYDESDTEQGVNDERGTR